MRGKMNITINGKPKQVAGVLTVGALLDALQLDGNRVAVELNRNVLRKEQFAAINLHNGDALEVVQFVGGG
jgi:thiamine biosynthesis protein ThiS